MSKTLRHFLDLSELPTDDLRAMLDASMAMKKNLKAGKPDRPLQDKTLAMIFERPTTRTRVSFEVGIRQLGGEAIMLTGQEMQLGRVETFADTAKKQTQNEDNNKIRILSLDALAEMVEFA